MKHIDFDQQARLEFFQSNVKPKLAKQAFGFRICDDRAIEFQPRLTTVIRTTMQGTQCQTVRSLISR